MTASADLLPLLAFEYGDTSYTSITEANWVTLINMAILDVVSARPDAYTQTKTLTLVAGTKQSIDTGDVRLVQVLRNTDGVTPGDAILGPWRQEDIDASEPSWHSATEVGTVVGYVWNDAHPRDFLVYPPALAGTKVDAIVATVPTALADETGDVPLGAQFWPAICDFALAYAYSRDDERSPNFARADRHHARALQRLGVKSRGDVSVSPPEAESQ